MIRGLLGFALQRTAGWFDDSVPEETIRTWFRDSWERSISAVVKDPDLSDASRPLRIVLDETARAASRAGLLTGLPSGLTGNDRVESAGDLSEARHWSGSHGANVVADGFVVPGTGQYLDALAAAAAPQDAQFVADAFESLLRHVEIRRRSALMLRHAQNDRERWLEKHSIAVTLSRHSCRTRDLRWLNAAFKLNDWAFPVHRRLRASLQLAHFLHAVAEQEAAAHELFA